MIAVKVKTWQNKNVVPMFVIFHDITKPIRLPNNYAIQPTTLQRVGDDIRPLVNGSNGIRMSLTSILKGLAFPKSRVKGVVGFRNILENGLQTYINPTTHLADYIFVSDSIVMVSEDLFDVIVAVAKENASRYERLLCAVTKKLPGTGEYGSLSALDLHHITEATSLEVNKRYIKLVSGLSNEQFQNVAVRSPAFNYALMYAGKQFAEYAETIRDGVGTEVNATNLHNVCLGNLGSTWHRWNPFIGFDFSLKGPKEPLTNLMAAFTSDLRLVKLAAAKRTQQ